MSAWRPASPVPLTLLHRTAGTVGEWTWTLALPADAVRHRLYLHHSSCAEATSAIILVARSPGSFPAVTISSRASARQSPIVDCLYSCKPAIRQDTAHQETHKLPWVAGGADIEVLGSCSVSFQQVIQPILITVTAVKVTAEALELRWTTIAQKTVGDSPG